jgi:hypothetical protein
LDYNPFSANTYSNKQNMTLTMCLSHPQVRASFPNANSFWLIQGVWFHCQVEKITDLQLKDGLFKTLSNQNQTQVNKQNWKSSLASSRQCQWICNKVRVLLLCVGSLHRLHQKSSKETKAHSHKLCHETFNNTLHEISSKYFHKSNMNHDFLLSLWTSSVLRKFRSLTPKAEHNGFSRIECRLEYSYYSHVLQFYDYP